MLAFLVLIISMIVDSKFFTMLRSKRGLYERQLEIYKSVPLSEYSVGVDSKE